MHRHFLIYLAVVVTSSSSKSRLLQKRKSPGFKMNEAIFFFSQQNIPFIGMKPKFPPKRSRIDYDLRMVSSWYLVGSSLRDQFLVCLEEERPGCVEQFCGLSCFLLFSPSEASCSLRRSNIKSIR